MWGKRRRLAHSGGRAILFAVIAPLGDKRPQIDRSAYVVDSAVVVGDVVVGPYDVVLAARRGVKTELLVSVSVVRALVRAVWALVTSTNVATPLR